jgi:ubiquitin-protein ligase
MSIRLRRLRAEYERLLLALDGHERIRIVEAIGRPPERYVIEFRVKGLTDQQGEIVERDTHLAEITLGPDYPRQMARCVMLTPVFHPNIDHLAVCTQDIGAAGQTLDRMILFIGEMITFQAYNLQAPRNGDAARWTTQNADRLPLETVNLFPAVLMPEVSTPVSAPESAPPVPAMPVLASPVPARADACANCGAPTAAGSRCAAGHDACENCRCDCGNCGLVMCLACDVRTCATCQHLFCPDCVVPCERCGGWTCLADASRPCGACTTAEVS